MTVSIAGLATTNSVRSRMEDKGGSQVSLRNPLQSNFDLVTARMRPLAVNTLSDL